MVAATVGPALAPVGCMLWKVWAPGIVVCATLGSCRVVREGTYPPTFDYIERSGIQSKMGALAHEVRALDQVFAEPSVDRAQVLSRLEAIDRITAELAVSGTGTNHPELDRKLEAFAKQVKAAKAGSSQSPPNDFLAGSISGACVYCHQ